MTPVPAPGIDFPGLGVGLVIRRPDGKVLMYRRLKAPEAGHWNIVGGKIDKMELAIDAARREAEEETGLKIGSIEFLCLVEGLLDQDGQHWVSLVYLAEAFEGEPVLAEPDKLAEFGWFAIDDAPQPLSFFSRQAFKHLLDKEKAAQGTRTALS